MAFKFPGVGSSVSIGDIEDMTLVTAAETIAEYFRYWRCR
jgi:hypothetical protein